MKFSSLIFANLFRKKLRLILTIASFAVALFLFAFLSVVKSAFSVMGRAEIAEADMGFDLELLEHRDRDPGLADARLTGEQYSLTVNVAAPRPERHCRAMISR